MHNVEKDKRIYVAGTHEPIVRKELLDRVQKLVTERKQRYFEGKEKFKNIERKENAFDNILFCGDCGGRLKFCRNIKQLREKVKVNYSYICPNSEAYGEKFCKKKMIKMQDLEEALETAARMHIKLFLDTREVFQNLNKSEQENG